MALDPRNEYSSKRNSNGETTGAVGATTGIIAVVLVILVAIGGFVFFTKSNDSNVPPPVEGASAPSFSEKVESSTSIVVDSTKDAASAAVDATKDAAAEVSQAASDAVTPGDQSTTRPNGDDSTKKLDQK